MIGRRSLLPFALILTLILVACESDATSTPTSTEIPTSTATPAPTASGAPTPIPTTAPTAPATPAPTAIPTLELAPTATPEPALPPQPGVHFTADTILTLRESVVRVIGSRAVGSGAIVDDQGLVVTGRNAVGNDPTVLVEMVDGIKKTGVVLGIDSIAGLAMLRISGDGYTSLPLGDVSSLKAGDALLTLGFPEQGAVGETEWELEALPAMVSAAGPAEGISYVNVAQSLAPGYAGGPTVDDQGRLVGLTASPGLIIMVDRLKEVMPSLRDGVDISVPAKEDIVYHSRETVLSEAFLFTTDEEGDSERLIPGQKTSNRFVERSPDGSKLVYASPQRTGFQLGHLHG